MQIGGFLECFSFYFFVIFPYFNFYRNISTLNNHILTILKRRSS